MLTARRRRDDGFTLIELVITVAIVGIIVVSLAGVLIQYLKVSVTAQTRMNESPDEQFVAAYLQQDVSAIGVHGYQPSMTSNPLPTSQSVWRTSTPSGVPAGCNGLAGTVIGFVWNDYSTATTDPNTGTWSGWTTNASVYVFSGTQLTRVRCVGSTTTTTTLAQRLTGASALCSGGAIAGCDDPTPGDSPPRIVTMTIAVSDKTGNGTSTTGYTTTLTAERRQS